MEVYLPIAGMSINVFLLLSLGGIVGFLSGLFGVGGGFIMTPIMMMAGIPPAIAAASDSNQIVAGAASGAYAHWRLRNVDFKLGSVLLAGGIVGGTAGVQLVKLLRALGNVEFVMKSTYVLMLSTIGIAMFWESLSTLRKRGVRAAEGPRKPRKASVWTRLPLQMTFTQSGIRTSAVFPFLIAMLVGTLAALLGVGGGFIMVPAMIYVIGMPTIVAVGTDLFQIVITTANVTFQQAISNHTVDIVLAMLLLVGSTIGAQLGARVGRRLRGEQIRILLALIVLAFAVKFVVDLLLPPSNLITLAGASGGH
ncbi:MAG: sulfite exporter TauE/SafE family protein [Deltaproteobacteria bacterium]|nr:sulfite exporter TauE/SafE family protein [Deltaproteobacteria bacterium]